MSRIVQLVKLIRYLESDAPAKMKILEINYARTTGLLTDDEAVELAVVLDTRGGTE